MSKGVAPAVSPSFLSAFLEILGSCTTLIWLRVLGSSMTQVWSEMLPVMTMVPSLASAGSTGEAARISAARKAGYENLDMVILILRGAVMCLASASEYQVRGG